MSKQWDDDFMMLISVRLEPETGLLTEWLHLWEILCHPEFSSIGQ